MIDTLGDVCYNVVAAIVAIIITNIMIECIRGTYSQTRAQAAPHPAEPLEVQRAWCPATEG
jgi:hypothetical protein